MANYVDNAKLLEVMTGYIEKWRSSYEKSTGNSPLNKDGKETKAYKKWKSENSTNEKVAPRLPEYAGKCIYLVATNTAKKACFFGYPFKEDMISDAIENMCAYAHNVDPTRPNVFAYFTQIAHYAFLRRIDKEKKQMYIKFRAYDAFRSEDEIEGDSPARAELNDISHAFIDSYESLIERRRNKDKKNESDSNDDGNQKRDAGNTVVKFFRGKDQN